jgi:bis(5'-nucleosyl)-tetraphosphatase (symmetrical)
MARFAIGDIQGCADELRALLSQIRFSADRDRLWFVGDLVNRGPQSLEALRYVRALGDNAIVVLGNHDLHLLAVALGSRDARKADDTLDAVLSAPDRDQLIEWLLQRPLAHFDAEHGDLMVHAGLVPQWTVDKAVSLAGEVEQLLREQPDTLFEGMYGDRPERWSEDLRGIERLRFTVNVLTRLRVCSADGRIDLKMKGPPTLARAPFRPWFEHPRLSQPTRVIFGHWSALGLVRSHGVLGIDTGCVWGGTLTALNLDARRAPSSVPCRGHRTAGAD